MARPDLKQSAPRRKKVLLKVIDGNDIVWEPFAYVDSRVWSKFKDLVHIEDCEIVYWIALWCKQDFKFTLRMATVEDVKMLKKCIATYYKDTYYELFSPEIGYAAITENDGTFVRNWLMIHLMEEIKKYEL